MAGDDRRAERPQERTAWVVGATGLLGSAVCRHLSAQRRDFRTTDVPWDDPSAAVEALLRAAEQLPGGLGGVLVRRCGSRRQQPGRARRRGRRAGGVPDSLGARRPAGNGFFLASSAGGVYAGSSGPPFTEHTEPAPISAYGQAKLRSEEIATEFAVRTSTALLVGRLANLYGPGQNLDKPQGLVSQLCLAQLTRQPLSVYVPLDTMRDYLFVDDAAAMAVAGLGAVTDSGRRALKVLASERSTTVGAVLGDLHRVTRRRPPVVLGVSPARATRCATSGCARWRGRGRRRWPAPLWFRGSPPRSRR